MFSDNALPHSHSHGTHARRNVRADARRIARRSAGLCGLVALLSAGCGGAPTAPKTDDVFYLHGGGVIDKSESHEKYFPKLDRDAGISVPRMVGVGVLGGDVRFSRPIDWTVRDASSTPERRFISYQSPRQFIFSILERVDPPTDTWPEIEKRYEAETKDLLGTFLSQREPVGSANAQGRSYLVKSKVKAKPATFDSYATEILLRGDNRVLLVQVVHNGDLAPLAEEVNRAVASVLVY